MDNSRVIKKYTKGDVTVVWEPGKCFHSGACVRGLPSVFDAKAKPWVNMDGAEAQAIIDQVNKCPSGALSILSNEAAKPKTETSIELMTNGPMIVEGHISITDKDGTSSLKNKKTAFCRCGASANKPFCDGAHKKIGFEG